MPLKNRHTKKKNTNRRRKQIKRGGKRFRKNTKKNVRNKRQTRRMRGGTNNGPVYEKNNPGLHPYSGDNENGFHTKPATTPRKFKYSMRNRDKFENEFKDIIPPRSWKQWWNKESNISELIDIVGKLKDETR